MEHPTTILQAFEMTGISGWLIALVTAAFVVAGIVSAGTRVSRLLAILLLAGSLLVPLGLGIAGLYTGRANCRRILSQLKAPTPADIALGERASRYSLVFGLGSALLCYTVVLPVFARSKASSEHPGTDTAIGQEMQS